MSFNPLSMFNPNPLFSQVFFPGGNKIGYTTNLGLTMTTPTPVNFVTGNLTSQPIIVGNATAATNPPTVAQFPATLATTGYFEIPVYASSTVKTLLIQWGIGSSHTVSAQSAVADALTFSPAFPTACINVQTCATISGMVGAASSVTKTGFTLETCNWTTISQTGQIYWLAVGY